MFDKKIGYRSSKELPLEWCDESRHWWKSMEIRARKRRVQHVEIHGFHPWHSMATEFFSQDFLDYCCWSLIFWKFSQWIILAYFYLGTYVIFEASWIAYPRFSPHIAPISRRSEVALQCFGNRNPPRSWQRVVRSCKLWAFENIRTAEVKWLLDMTVYIW